MFWKSVIACCAAAVLVSSVALGTSSRRTESMIDLVQSNRRLCQERDELVARIHKGQMQLSRAMKLETARPADIQRQLTSLDGLREAVEIELISKQAQAAELQKQIKKYQDELAARAKSDPVSAQLQKVIAPVEDEAQRKRSNPQTYAPTEIAVAEANAASEQVRLLERQEQFGADAPLLTELRHDQIYLADEIAELQARYNLLTERGNVMRSVQRYLDHANEWQCKLEKLNAKIHGDERSIEKMSGSI